MYSVGIIIALFLYLIWENPPRLSPDGGFYLHRPRIKPYVLRFPFVFLLREYPKVWLWISRLSTLSTALILDQFHGLVPAVLFLGLASTRLNTTFPILVDQFGIWLLTICWLIPPPFNFLLAIFGGLVSEKIPVLAFFLTQNPLCLLGLIFPAIAYFHGEDPKPEDPQWLKTPFSEARKVPFSVQNLILPWGIASVGLLTTPISWIIIAYLQLFVAQDRARLYQWIGPMVCVYAATNLPDLFVVPFLVLHFLNPWRSVV